MNAEIAIGGRLVGAGHPVYIVAELSANHRQSFEVAVELVRAAKRSGADAVKVQTYTPDTITLASDREPFRIGKGSIWEGRILHDLYGEAHMPWEWQPKLAAVARDVGLDFFSTCFDPTSLEFLERMQVPVHKIASFELVDLPLIRLAARTGKPLIVSTGMATLEEIAEAVATMRGEGNERLVLLKCTSAYPAPAEETNLRTLPDLAARFGVAVGLSDHTLGIAPAAAAVALGACLIEKHMTLSRADGGPDAAFSLEPPEFARMVDAVRTTEQALGRVSYDVTPREAASRVFRKSLFVVADMKAGQPFTPHTVRCIRPGHGLHPRHLDEVMGRAAVRDIPRGTPLEWSLVGPACRRPGEHP